MSNYLNTSEAAQRMGVSVETVRNLCNDGQLPGAFQEYENGPWRIPVADVEAWIQHHPPPPTPANWRQRLRHQLTAKSQ
jgi:excisionase family DNA binding protein